MIVYDKNVFGSNREIDDTNGYLRVSECNITKAQVRPYKGEEIPCWRDFNLDPEKIYNVVCLPEELEKAAETFNNLPLTRDHIAIDVNDVPKERIIGSLGDHAVFEYPYLKNNIIVYDKKDIDNIMNGKRRELSCGYRYTPIREEGEFDGQHYDFKMTDIIGNHVAIVKQGRAGHDVMVADTIEMVKDKIMGIFSKKTVNDEFKESEHPRDKGGRFTSAGGEGSGILKTKGLMEHLQKSIEAQKAENPNAKIGDTIIDLDRYISLYGDTLSTEEYNKFNVEKAEEEIFNKLHEMEKEAGFKEESSEKKDYEEKTQSFEDFYKDFERREDNNDHSGNAVALAKRYGDEKDVKEAEEILKLHDERMELTPDLYKRRRVLEEKFIPMMSKEGESSENKEKSKSEKTEESKKEQPASKETVVEKLYKKLSKQGLKGEALQQAIYEKHGIDGVEELRAIQRIESGEGKNRLRENESVIKSLEENLSHYKTVVSNFEKEGINVNREDYLHYKKMVETTESAINNIKEENSFIKRHLTGANNLTEDKASDKMEEKELPAGAGEPEKAGEEEALNQGVTDMAEEVKEVETKEEEKVVEPKEECSEMVEDKSVDKRKLIDEIGGILEGKIDDELIKTILGKAEELAYNGSEKSADDEKPAEDEKIEEVEEAKESKEEKSEEKKEDEEPTKDSCGKKEMAKDSALVMDADAIRAEGRAEALADYKAREIARKSVRSIIGDVDVFAFDSADEIYKFACEKAGMDLTDIASYKDAFRGLSARKGKLAMDASPISGSNEECFKDIRLA